MNIHFFLIIIKWINIKSNKFNSFYELIKTHIKWIILVPHYLFKYNRGIDQFIYENIKYKTYNKEDGYCSFQTVLDEQDYPVYLFNQRNANMKNKDWYSRYFINV